MPERLFKGEYKGLSVDELNRLEIPSPILTALEFNDHAWRAQHPFEKRQKVYGLSPDHSIPLYLTNVLRNNTIKVMHISHLDDKVRRSYRRLYYRLLDNHHRLQLMGVDWQQKTVDVIGEEYLFSIRVHNH